METKENHNQTDNQPQENIRFASLRRWMYPRNLTFVDFGRTCGVCAAAMQRSLRRQRMPVRHHQTITATWPDLPVELLPVPMDIPTGPKPKGLPDILDDRTNPEEASS